MKRMSNVFHPLWRFSPTGNLVLSIPASHRIVRM